MSLSSVITKNIALELTAKVSSLLSSISGKVSDVDTIVAQVVDQYMANRQFNPNNDLGMLVRRIQEIILSTETQQEQMNYEAQYDKVRDSDDQVSIVIHVIAHRIAAVLATALNTLKVTVADDCERLVKAIEKAEAAHVEPTRTVDIAMFDWGALADPTVRANAVQVARTLTNTFKSDTPSMFDAGNLLTQLPVERITDMSMSQAPAADTTSGFSDYLKQQLRSRIRDTSAEYLASTIDILTKPYRYTFWVNDTVIALTNASTPIAQAVIDITKRIDAIADITMAIQNSDLGLGEGTGADLRNNAAIVERQVALFRAVLITYKEGSLAKALVMSDQYVQASVYQEYTAAGGTKEDIVAYIRYNTEVAAGGKVPGRGVSSEIVKMSAERMAKAVSDKDAANQKSDDEQKRIAFEQTLTTVLNAYFQDSQGGNASEDDLVRHKAAMQKAMLSYTAGVVSLYTIITDYLVAVRGDRMVQLLHRALSDTYTAAVQAATGGQVDEGMVATLTLRVVLGFVWDPLLLPFTTDVLK